MPERFRVFWDAKLGSPAKEFEDAFWPGTPGTGSGVERRYAVADGATESSYSRHWAELLVEAYGGGAVSPGALIRALPDLQETWRSSHENTALPWFAAEKVAMGAFAALLGVSITGEGTDRKLSALAVGDSCLVVVGTDEGRSRWPMKSRWPIKRSGDFGLNPALLSSAAAPDSQRPLIRRRHVELAPRDTLFLMTDAIAAWFLREAEEGGRPWSTLLDVAPGGDDGFREWARDLRTTGAMRDDDVTVAIVDPE